MKFAIYEMYDNGIQFTRESNFITEIIYSPFNISIEGIQVLLIYRNICLKFILV